MAHPVIIGLTGSIAMGKSTAADMLRNMGIPVHCSDDAAHDIMAKGGAGYHAILAAFSDVENLLDDAGEIDRKGALGPFIYTHRTAKHSSKISSIRLCAMPNRISSAMQGKKALILSCSIFRFYSKQGRKTAWMA